MAADKEEIPLDSILESALKECGASSAQDAIVIALHSNFLSAGYQCVGTGDQDVQETSAVAVSTASSPKLPSEWNKSQDAYSLRYFHKPTKKICFLKVISMEDEMLVSAAAGDKTEMVISLTLKVSSYIKGSSYSSPSVYCNVLQLMALISRDLEAKLTQICEVSGTGSGSGTLAEEMPRTSAGGQKVSASRSDPLVSSGPLRPPGQVDPPHGQSSLLVDDRGAFGYGDRDRLPPVGGDFGIPGGGMIFDPLRQGGGQGRYGPRGPFPPGHPPGARFDPVSPFGLPRPHPPNPFPRSYGPDPDHLPPPGYDDMFQ